MASDNVRTVNSGSMEQESFWTDRKNLRLLIAVLLLTLVVYLPSLQNGFVNWDDQANVYRNYHVINTVNLEDLAETIPGIFSNPLVGNYNPLPILTFAVEHMLFGLDNPEWFHLTNILLHLVCVLLVFRIASALGLKLVPAAFCALLFGIQPMRVESVAWVTERKDVLYGSFFLLSLYFYIKSLQSSFPRRYLFIILGSFILSLLSKIQAVTLPLTMLLADYYLGRELRLKLIYEKWLYFTLSLATGIAGVYFLRGEGSMGSTAFFSFFERLFIGAYSYVVYLIKSVVPYELVPVYPYPAEIGWIFYASAIPAFGILGAMVYFFRKGYQAPVFGLLFFTVNIIFLLQIFGAGQGFIADRFTYIAYFGLFFMYARGLQWALERYAPLAKPLGITALLVLVAFGYLSFEQNRIWKNGESLWTHVLAHYPATSLAWENRADYYREAGQAEKAVRDFSQAILLKPNNPAAYHGRGTAYLDPNLPEKNRLAIQDFSKAIRLAPGTSGHLIKRGIAYLNQGRFDQALQDFNAAEELNPGNQEIYYYRSRIHFRQNRYDRAQADLERYLEIRPDDSSMWSNLGTLGRLRQQYAKSLRAFNRAIEINPEALDYYYKRSLTFYEMGDLQRARDGLKFLKSSGFKGIDPEYEKLLSQGK